MLNMPQICSCFRDNTLHPKISSNQPENPSSGSNCSCGAGNVARFILPQLRGKKAEHSLAAVLGQRRANSGSRLPPSLRSSGSSSVKKAASHAAIIPATPTRARRAAPPQKQGQAEIAHCLPSSPLHRPSVHPSQRHKIPDMHLTF